MNVTPEQVVAGQAVYNPRTLRIYDLMVHGVSNPLIWRCPTRRLLQHYQRHASSNHLDVGVGTGFFPDRCRWSSPPRIGLLDLNPHTLRFASRRIARYRPETYQRNLFEPIRFDAARFDSIGLSYVLHCLPGTMSDKGAVFDHLTPLLNPGGVVFGATLLQGGVQRGMLARGLMAIYNRKGIFDNRNDDLASLSTALERRFGHVQVEVIGCVALFSGQVDGRPGG